MFPELKYIYPDIVVRMLRVYATMQEQTGHSMRPCQGLRSIQEQNRVYAQGRSTPGKVVSYAVGLNSLHCFGLAIDSCFTGVDPWKDRTPDGVFLWAEYGRYSKAFGLSWGGDFKRRLKGKLVARPDRPHVELLYGLSLKEIKNIYRTVGLIGLWARIDQIRGVEIGQDWLHFKDELAKF